MKPLRALPAIRAKCLDCCCGSATEVRKCTIKDCPLWPLRFGHYPKSNLTPETPVPDGKEAANPGEGYTDTPEAVRGGTGDVCGRREGRMAWTEKS